MDKSETRFPLSFKITKAHNALAKELGIKVEEVFTRFKIHHLTSAYKGIEVKHDDWNSVFFDYMREYASYQQTLKSREDKTEMAILQKTHDSLEAADFYMGTMVREGKLKFDGTIYKNNNGFVVSAPFLKAKEKQEINYDNLSCIDKLLVDDLKKEFKSQWQSCNAYKELLHRYNHVNYARLSELDKISLAAFNLMPLGERIVEYRKYLQNRKNMINE